MKCKVARTLLVFVALLFNLLGFLLKTGYAPLADDVLIAGAALEIVGALVLLGKPQASSSNKMPVVLLVSALLASLCYLFWGQLFFYDDRRLAEAWQHRETRYPQQWIAHLGNLEFVEFGDRITT